MLTDGTPLSMPFSLDRFSADIPQEMYDGNSTSRMRHQRKGLPVPHSPPLVTPISIDGTPLDRKGDAVEPAQSAPQALRMEVERGEGVTGGGQRRLKVVVLVGVVAVVVAVVGVAAGAGGQDLVRLPRVVPMEVVMELLVLLLVPLVVGLVVLGLLMWMLMVLVQLLELLLLLQLPPPLLLLPRTW